MQAWAKDQKIEGSIITFLADPLMKLTEALDMKMVDFPDEGIVGRCKRFAMYVDDEQIKSVQVSETDNDPSGDDDPTKSLAMNMIQVVKDDRV